MAFICILLIVSKVLESRLFEEMKAKMGKLNAGKSELEHLLKNEQEAMELMAENRKKFTQGMKRILELHSEGNFLQEKNIINMTRLKGKQEKLIAALEQNQRSSMQLDETKLNKNKELENIEKTDWSQKTNEVVTVRKQETTEIQRQIPQEKECYEQIKTLMDNLLSKKNSWKALKKVMDSIRSIPNHTSLQSARQQIKIGKEMNKRLSERCGKK